LKRAAMTVFLLDSTHGLADGIRERGCGECRA
jgi:hypothetical protein